MSAIPPRLERLEFLAAWSDCWSTLCDAFPHSARKASDMELYAERIKDLGTDCIRAAVEQCIATCRYFPTVAEIREAASVLVGVVDPTPLDVYGDTMRELSLAQAESRVPRLDPIAKEVVASMGGSMTLLVSKDGKIDRAHFTKSYLEKRTQLRRREAVVPMAQAALGESERAALPAASPTINGRLQGQSVEARPLSPDEAAELIRQIRSRGGSDE